MNARERFLRSMHFQSCDRVPLWELVGFWKETLDRWHMEGLPPEIDIQSLRVDDGGFEGGTAATSGPQNIPTDIFGYAPFHKERAYHRQKFRRFESYFGFDPREIVPINEGPVPAFERKLLSEDTDSITFVDDWGVTKRVLKGLTSMPAFLSFPVSGQSDFDRIRERFDPHSDERYPADWDGFLTTYDNRDFPIGLSFLGFFAWPRTLMGFDRMLPAFYDQPDLLNQMIDFWCDFLIALSERALEEVEIDFVIIGEDMSYNHGPFMSPMHFRRFMLPSYKRLIQSIRRHGVDLILVDSDGNPSALLPALIEAGVTGIWPLEAQSGMDPVALRRKYGQALVLWGGLDKHTLAQNPQAIEVQVRERVLPLVKAGGYIPSLDHFVPNDVPWSNYQLYLDLLKDAIGYHA